MPQATWHQQICLVVVGVPSPQAVAGIIVDAPTSSPSPTSLWYSPLQTVKATQSYSKNPTLRSSSRCASPLSPLSSSPPSSLLNTTAQRRVQLGAVAAQPLLPQTQLRLRHQARPVSSTLMSPLEATYSSTPTISMHRTALLLHSTSPRQYASTPKIKHLNSRTGFELGRVLRTR